MKEKSITLKTHDVRAILDGRKSQVRQVIKAVPTIYSFHGWVMSSTCAKDEGKACWAIGDSPLLRDPIRLNCPLGKIGDRLWARETWQGPLVDYENANKLYKDPEPFQSIKNCVYKADGVVFPEYFDADDNLRYGWKSSTQMPRWASRILLEITAVRVEHLQDISEEDAIAEGIITGRYGNEDNWLNGFYTPGNNQPYQTAKAAYAELWRSIHGVDSWYMNSWVWVVEFKQVAS